MTMAYAQNTTVSVDKSIAEVKNTLNRYGATGFGFAETAQRAMVQFRIQDRVVRLDLTLPDRAEKRFTRTPGGRHTRDAAGALAAWEQACRQRWRALALVVKAKLEAVDAGISTIEKEFFADVLLPGGMTVYEQIAEQIDESYASGKMPALIGFERP